MGAVRYGSAPRTPLREQRERLGPEELRALLTRHGLPAYEAVLRFEERFGSLTFTWDDEHSFGVAWEYGSDVEPPPERIEKRIVVRVGRHGDFFYLMDERGLIYEKHWEESPRLVADSLPDLLDDLALRTE